MSLLIKALDKAEKAQADKVKKTQTKRRPKALKTDFGSTGQFQSLSLAEPNADLLQGSAQPDSNLPLSNGETLLPEKVQKPLSDKTGEVSAASISRTADAHPDRAANVFAAKRTEPTHQNAKLAILAGVALLALLAMGWYVYQALHVTPVPMPSPRPMPPIAQTQSPATTVGEKQPTPAVAPAPVQTQAFAEPIASKPEEPLPAQPSSRHQTGAAESVKEAFDLEKQAASTDKGAPRVRGDISTPSVASPSVAVSVSKNKPEAGVNPTLMRAYEAYNAGNDQEAQMLYKQVLQRDIHNVDALLGLGGIAARQGRDADAKGWYRKVLDVEPRNTIAQSAILSNQGADEGLSNEGRLKAMVEKSPNDANLHAKLGHWYADQNQWAAAQQAYFEANRLNPNAENAFNLAVSLDQLGKPKLALPYYQKALETITSTSGIDQSALEARIQAIQ